MLLQTLQILKNDDEVINWSLSSFLLAVLLENLEKSVKDWSLFIIDICCGSKIFFRIIQNSAVISSLYCTWSHWIKVSQISFIVSISAFSCPLVQIQAQLKKFVNPFCFACTLGLLPCLKAKWVQLNGKTLQVLKTSLSKATYVAALSLRVMWLESLNFLLSYRSYSSQIYILTMKIR